MARSASRLTTASAWPRPATAGAATRSSCTRAHGAGRAGVADLARGAMCGSSSGISRLDQVRALAGAVGEVDVLCTTPECGRIGRTAQRPGPRAHLRGTRWRRTCDRVLRGGPPGLSSSAAARSAPGGSTRPRARPGPVAGTRTARRPPSRSRARVGAAAAGAAGRAVDPAGEDQAGLPGAPGTPVRRRQRRSRRRGHRRGATPGVPPARLPDALTSERLQDELLAAMTSRRRRAAR